MRIRLRLLTLKPGVLIPINYQYPLSAAIYKILAGADRDYATFLHNKGYTPEASGKAFKLFSFSDLKTPFQIKGDRLQLLTGEAELRVSFHLPEAAENFIKGLFINQRLEIADKRSKAVFTVSQVDILPIGLREDNIQEILLRPSSPLVCGIKEEGGKYYKFLSPEDIDFTSQLINNWKEKYRAAYGADEVTTAFNDAFIEVIFYSNPPNSRLITIKATTNEETKIRGFVNFRLKVKGSKKALALLLNAGAGIYNAQGMGAVENASNDN